MRKSYIVLPAYNEADSLPLLLEAVRLELGGSEYEVIVVDDGSADGTAPLAEAMARIMPIKVVKHGRNRGLAAALRTGLVEASRLAAPDDAIVTMDADNTHHPRHIRDMLALLDDGCDVVIASRYRRGSSVHGLSWGRRFVSLGAAVVFKLLQPTKGVRDYTCGYRAYRASAIKEMLAAYGDGPGGFVSEQGFSCMADVILKMRRHGYRFAEVPLELRYDLKLGVSKMKVIRTVRQSLSLLLRRLAGR